MVSFMGPYSSTRTETGVAVAMRDGATLYADIYRPDTTDPVPVLLQRTPYKQGIGQQPGGKPGPHQGRIPRLRHGDPGHPGPVCLGGRVLPLPQRGGRRLRHRRMVCLPALEFREGGDVWCFLRGSHPVVGRHGRTALLGRHRPAHNRFRLLRGLDLPGRCAGLGVHSILDTGAAVSGQPGRHIP